MWLAQIYGKTFRKIYFLQNRGKVLFVISIYPIIVKKRSFIYTPIRYKMSQVELTIELPVKDSEERQLIENVRNIIAQDLPDFRDHIVAIRKLLGDDYHAGCEANHIWIHRSSVKHSMYPDKERFALINQE